MLWCVQWLSRSYRSSPDMQTSSCSQNKLASPFFGGGHIKLKAPPKVDGMKHGTTSDHDGRRILTTLREIFWCRASCRLYPNTPSKKPGRDDEHIDNTDPSVYRATMTGGTAAPITLYTTPRQVQYPVIAQGWCASCCSSCSSRNSPVSYPRKERARDHYVTPVKHVAHAAHTAHHAARARGGNCRRYFSA